MVGSISHELRTPLNGLMILLGCAKNAPNIADGFFDKYLKPALDCSDFLLNIINDILDYTQMNFKKELRLVLEEVSLKALLSSVVELLKMKAKLRRLKLIIEVDEDIPDVFTTEPRRLKQIMLNLTGNALKFTFEGHIKIMADKIEVEGAQTCIKISVEDTGLGMKDDDLQHLFKMFGKLEATREENKSGTGLGLMISNKLALRLAPKDNKGIQVESVY